jgi:translation initiation factor eIF-2B subunit epsilon
MPSTSKEIPDEEAEVLQAVILADSFNKRFKPLTSDRPKVFRRVHFVYCV